MYIKKIVPKNTLQSSSERKMPAVAVKTSKSNANKDLQKLSHLVSIYEIGQS